MSCPLRDAPDGVKVGEEFARAVEELAPLEGPPRTGGRVHQLQHQRAAGADVRAAGQEVATNLGASGRARPGRRAFVSSGGPRQTPPAQTGRDTNLGCHARASPAHPRLPRCDTSARCPAFGPAAKTAQSRHRRPRRRGERCAPACVQLARSLPPPLRAHTRAVALRRRAHCSFCGSKHAERTSASSTELLPEDWQPTTAT